MLGDVSFCLLDGDLQSLLGRLILGDISFRLLDFLLSRLDLEPDLSGLDLQRRNDALQICLISHEVDPALSPTLNQKTLQSGPDLKALCLNADRGCRRSGRQAPLLPPSPARRDGCARACPGGPRNCGSRSRHSAPWGEADPGSCRGTSSSLARASRSLRP